MAFAYAWPCVRITLYQARAPLVPGQKHQIKFTRIITSINHKRHTVLLPVRDKPTCFESSSPLINYLDADRVPGSASAINTTENTLATTYRNDRKRQTVPMSMVTQCILIVLCKVPSNRETTSGQVSDEFPIGLVLLCPLRGCPHV